LLHTQDVQRSFDVKLLDFGIAKLTADARTMATSAVGTPLWMAPEQTDPRAKIAPTADVWPLGLLVFTMLTGHSYWRVAADPSVSVQALMREILFEAVDAPSVRAVELGIDVPLPVGLDAWFLRCLDREPSRRFSSANEAWEALVPVLGSEVQPPARLAALTSTAGALKDRMSLEAAATAPVGASHLESASTKLAPGLSGMEATVDASALAAVAASGHTTGLSVGQTVPTTGTSQRSTVRTFGAIAAAALIGVVSWQVATSRAEHQRLAGQENVKASSSSSETIAPTNSAGAVTTFPNVLPSNLAGPVVVPDAPLPASSSIVPAVPPKPPTPPKPKLPGFDAAAAQRSVDFLAAGAKFTCGRLPGPRAFGVTVTFSPAGRAIKVHANMFVAEPTATCAENVLFGAYVPPYDPVSGNGVAVASVSMD
jgi:hypothetical protein